MNEFATALGRLFAEEQVEKYFGTGRKIERWIDDAFIVQDDKTGYAVAVAISPADLASHKLDLFRWRMRCAAQTMDKCAAECLAEEAAQV